jgi:hypothetical protein
LISKGGPGGVPPFILSNDFGHGKAANGHGVPRPHTLNTAQGVKEVEGSVFRIVRDGGKLWPSVRFNNASD